MERRVNIHTMKNIKYTPFNPKLAEFPKPTINPTGIADSLNEAERLSDNSQPSTALDILENRIKDIPAEDLYAYVKYFQGLCYKKMSYLEKATENLARAVTALEESLAAYKSQTRTWECAVVQNDLGAVCALLAEYSDKENNNTKAIQAYESARTILEEELKAWNPKELQQQYWFFIQMLSSICNALADFRETENNLRQTVLLCQNPENRFLKEKYPSLYAGVQYNLGHALHTLSQFQTPEENRRGALEAFREALTIYNLKEFPFEYAYTQNNIANLYIDFAQSANQEMFLNQAIIACKEVLSTLTSGAGYSLAYALILHNLGSACKLYSNTRNRWEYLEKARQYFEAVLEVDNLPVTSELIASTYLNLGIIHNLIAAHQDALLNLSQAATFFKKALQIYNVHEYPVKYAVVQNNLGDTLRSLARVDQEPINLSKAEEAYLESLSIFKMDAFPKDYIQLHCKLGAVFCDLAKRAYQKELIEKALAAYEMALKAVSETNSDDYRAAVTGIAEAYIIMGEAEHNPEIINKALQSYENILTNLNPGQLPEEYSSTVIEIGSAYRLLAKMQNKEINLSCAIKLYQNAIKILEAGQFGKVKAVILEQLGFTLMEMGEPNPKGNYWNLAMKAFIEALQFFRFEKFPQKYSVINNALGKCYQRMASIGETTANLQRAYKGFENALKYYTLENFPQEYATNMRLIGVVYRSMAESLKDVDIKTANECNEYKVDRLSNASGAFKGALKVFTLENYPADYAEVQFNLGEVYSVMATVQNANEYRAKAIEAFEEALKVFTPEANPAFHKKVKIHLERERSLQ